LSLAGGGDDGGKFDGQYRRDDDPARARAGRVGETMTVPCRGLAVALLAAVVTAGTVWTAVNERDNIPYPSHGPSGTYSDAFGQVIQDYVNNHPPGEVVPVTAGRDLGWPGLRHSACPVPSESSGRVLLP
jgi:hypothetical protein